MKEIALQVKLKEEKIAKEKQEKDEKEDKVMKVKQLELEKKA